MDRRTLLSEVEAAFAVTGAGTPGWPDPHGGTREPRPEEYSRCPDPGKYRILAARGAAWVDVLTRLGLADEEAVDDEARAWRDEPRDRETGRLVRLRPRRSGAIPLLFAFRAMLGVPDTVVDIGAGEPAVRLETVPDCGCDACDDGSEGILEVLDRQVLGVVSGDLVHVTTSAYTVMSVGDGWSAHGRTSRRRPDVERILADARAGRSRHRVVRGESWW